MNHNFYNYYYFHSNGSIPLSTPRKKNIEEREGGKYFEYILFKQKLVNITLNQARYILNEKNYEKNLFDFTQGFLSLKENDLIIEGEFEELNPEISKLTKGKENLSEIFITTDDDDLDFNDIFIDAEVEDDVIGSYV